MDANESAALIDRVGGPTAFGKLLGIDNGNGWIQRVSNWRTRGIPSAVILEHYETFQRLRADKRRKAS